MSDTDGLTQVSVEMTVTEEVTYGFLVTVEVPTEVAGDRDTLKDYLAQNESLWLDDLPVNGGSDVYLSVNEREVEEIKILALVGTS